MQVLQNCLHLFDISYKLFMSVVQVQEEMTNRRCIRMVPMEMLGCQHCYG